MKEGANTKSQNKVAVIIGVGPGLARSVALKFSKEGYAVGLISRKEANCKAVHDEITQLGDRAPSKYYLGDATDETTIKTIFASIVKDLGEVSILLYNAAFRPIPTKGILELTPDYYLLGLKVGALGALIAMQQVLPHMVQQKSGTILLTGATASIKASPRFAAFASGKHALRALGQSTAKEFGPQGIHVAHVIIDGLIGDPQKSNKFIDPNSIANVYWMLHQQDPSCWTQEMDIRPFNEKF